MHQSAIGVFGGEPSHRARQVHIGGQLLETPVALHVDADRNAGFWQEFGACQPGDQQNVLHASVKRCRNLTKQQPGRVNAQ